MLIKPTVDSYCEEEGKIKAVCPFCKQESEINLFKSDTSLYINSIRLKEIHNKKFALCTGCKKAFEVEL